jgi:HAD superfamily hydrolase (TIGR01490 family)
MNSKIAAVFDLDRTLTKVRSLESAFIRFLLQEGHIGTTSLLHSGGFFLRNILHDPVTAIKRNKMYLKGFSLEQIELLTQSFLARRGPQLIPREAIRLVNNHKQSGHLTILVTGAPEFLVCPLIQLLNLPFDHLYATRLKVDRSVYSGVINGVHYYGREKEILVRKISSDFCFSLENSYCYADSESDIPMMELFGKPIAVNPDKELSKKSLRCDWQILTTA